MSNEPEVDDAIVACPATIFLQSGIAFCVREVGAWRLDEAGVFASGQWSHSLGSPEIDMWFPLSSVLYIQYHYDELEAFVESMQTPDEPESQLRLVGDE